MNRRKLLSVWLTVLLVTLPIYSSLVFADLREVTAYGSDGIHGTVKETDDITFSVVASVPTDSDITREQVRLAATSTPFDSCTAGVEGFTCLLTQTGLTFSNDRATNYIIALYDDSNVEVDRETGVVAVDNLEPEIITFAITPISLGVLNLSYTAEDYSFAYPDTTACSGLDKVEFYLNDFNGALLATQVVTSSDCEISSGAAYVPTITEGTLTICAKAYDKVGHASDDLMCNGFTIDLVPPSINDLYFANRNGVRTSFIGPGNNDLAVTVTVNDLDLYSLRGDFSSVMAGRDDVTFSCTGNSPDYVCSYDVTVDSDGALTYDFMVTALDTYGNAINRSFTQTLALDTTAPTVTSLQASSAVGLSSYVHTGDNTFVATITEDGAGLDPSQVFLHVSGTSYEASSCDSTGCTFEDVPVTSTSSLTAYIGADSQDLAGNSFSGRYETQFSVDSVEPVVEEISIEVFSGASGEPYNYPVFDDSLIITATVAETSDQLAATADLSNVISGLDAAELSCIKTDFDTFACELLTEPITASGYLETTVDFTFTDVAGNAVSVTENIIIYGETQLAADFWTSKVTCSPSKLDRETTHLVEQKIFCHVGLSENGVSPSAEEVSPLAFTLGDCSGDNDLIVEDENKLFNAQPGSKNPYVSFTLFADEFKIDKLRLECPLSVISKVGNNINQVPEIENVSVVLPFFNLPLGEFGEKTKDKIEEAKDFSFLIGEWVEVLDTIFGYGEKICGLLNSIFKILGFLKGIGIDLSLVESTTPPPAQGFFSDIRQGINYADQGMQNMAGGAWKDFANGFCKFFSCRLFADEWLGMDGLGEWQRDVLEVANTVAIPISNTEVPILKFIYTGQNAYEVKKDSKETGLETHLAGKLNPKDSLVLSTLTLCLPGIVSNLNKLRQINCMYVDCLQTNAEDGLPLKECDDNYHYATCKYVTGEIFQLAPLTGLFDKFIGLIKEALSSPAGFVDLVGGFVCNDKIGIVGQGGWLYNTCAINDFFGFIADVYSDLSNQFSSDYWSGGADYCDGVL